MQGARVGVAVKIFRRSKPLKILGTARGHFAGSKSRLPSRSVLLHFVQRCPPDTRTLSPRPKKKDGFLTVFLFSFDIIFKLPISCSERSEGRRATRTTAAGGGCRKYVLAQRSKFLGAPSR